MSAARTSRSARRRSLMAGALLATVLLTALALRFVSVSSSGTAKSAASASVSVPDGATTLTGGTATDVVALTVYRPETGTTAVDVRLTPRHESAAATASPSVTVSAVMPTMGHAVPGFTAVAKGDHRYHVAGLPLMMIGRWELLVDIDGNGRHDHLVFPLTLTR